MKRESQHLYSPCGLTHVEFPIYSFTCKLQNITLHLSYIAQLVRTYINTTSIFMHLQVSTAEANLSEQGTSPAQVNGKSVHSQASSYGGVQPLNFALDALQRTQQTTDTYICITYSTAYTVKPTDLHIHCVIRSHKVTYSIL